MYGSNFIKEHSETVMVCNYQNADCNLRQKNYCVIYYDFQHTFVPYSTNPQQIELMEFRPYGVCPCY